MPFPSDRYHLAVARANQESLHRERDALRIERDALRTAITDALRMCPPCSHVTCGCVYHRLKAALAAGKA